MLHEFLAENTLEILARTRAKVAKRTNPVPTEAQLKNGVPLFMIQLIDRLSIAAIDTSALQESAALHGGELLAMGFTVSQVIHGYGDVCQVITQLAAEMNAPITVEEFQRFHQCLDDAMAHSVTEYQRRRDASIAGDETERLELLARELHHRLADAMRASALLQKGNAAIGGSTGAVLGRNLRGMGKLVANALVGVDLESRLGRREGAGSEPGGGAETEAPRGAGTGDLAEIVAPVARGLDSVIE